MGRVTRCGLCGGTSLKPVLDLGSQPLAENDNGEWYPLELIRCEDCRLVQLSFIPDQHEVFPPDHPYASGNTKALREHFWLLAVKASEYLGYGTMLVDIGANDGTFASTADRMLSDNGVKVVAVEPTRQIRKLAEVTAYEAFFTSELGVQIRSQQGPAKVITACNVLAHVPDPHDFLRGVTALLADDGVFITENHDWASVANGLQIDTVYHEHLRYYSVATLTALLEQHGLLTIEAERLGTHGGSFRVTAVRERRDLASRAKAARTQLCQLLADAAQEGPVYGIGATTRATPLIHYTWIEEFLQCVCEVAGSDKIGQVIPGTKIPVVPEARLIANQPPHALLLAWHLADSIVPKLRKAGYHGKIIMPLPEPRILNG